MGRRLLGGGSGSLFSLRSLSGDGGLSSGDTCGALGGEIGLGLGLSGLLGGTSGLLHSVGESSRLLAADGGLDGGFALCGLLLSGP